MYNFRMYRLLLGSLLLIAVSGCGGNADDAQKQADALSAACRVSPKNCTEIYGAATVYGPLSAAAVNVFGPSGVRIGTATTAANGSFSLYVAQPVPDYSIVVSGGNYQGRTFSGDLAAEVRNRPAQGQFAPVNPVTTIVAQQMKASPTLSLAQSTADIQRFLDIPTAYGVGLNLTPRQFSGRLFATAIDNSGGITPLVTSLLQELNAGKTHTFHETVLEGAGVDVTLFVAKGLASGVLGKVGGEAFSSIMSAVGFGDSSSAAAKAAAEAAAAQMAKLVEIANAVNALSTKLDAVQSSLLQAIDRSTYVTAVTQNVQNLVVINETIDVEMRALAIGGSVDRRDKLNDYIFKNLVQGGLQSWHSSLYGTVTRDSSLLVLWGKIARQVKSNVYDASQADAIETQWEYFDSQQARSVAYIVEYMRSTPGYESSIVPTLNLWRANRKLQMALLKGNSKMNDVFYYPQDSVLVSETTPLNALPPSTIIDKTTNQMWYQGIAADTYGPITTVALGYFPAGVNYGARQVTGVDGWNLPPTRASVPHKTTDISHFDGLRRLGVRITDDCTMFYGETIGQRMTDLFATWPRGGDEYKLGYPDNPYYQSMAGLIEATQLFYNTPNYNYWVQETNKLWLTLAVTHDNNYYFYRAADKFEGYSAAPSFVLNDTALGPNGVMYDTNFRACLLATQPAPQWSQ